MRKLLVGLGNPWPCPKHARHNLGSLVLQALAHHLDLSWEWRWGCWGWLAAAEDLLLFIPGGFYNNSGWGVQRVLGLWDCEHDLIVLHDDIDLETFCWSFRNSGSDAGNRGLRSVLEAVGGRSVSRLRLGVGRPASRSPTSVAAYVLGSVEEALLERWRSAVPTELMRILSSEPGTRGKLTSKEEVKR